MPPFVPTLLPSLNPKNQHPTWTATTIPAADIFLENLGAKPKMKMQICQGDCDKDSDCATGLKCFLRSTGERVPGCLTGGGGDVANYDYCYDITGAQCDEVLPPGILLCCVLRVWCSCLHSYLHSRSHSRTLALTFRAAGCRRCYITSGCLS